MNHLPIIDQLSTMRTDADRATWLRQCPDSVIAEHHDAIRDSISAIGFARALPYLWTRLAVVQAVRQPDGRIPLKLERSMMKADITMDGEA